MPKKKTQSNPLADFLLAFSFLTIIPVPVKQSGRKNASASTMGYFPVVGLCIGLISLTFVSVFENIFSQRLNNLLLVLLPIVLSGGLHVDGLADFFDAFFQGRNSEDILRVMRDSRIGVWGTLSVIFIILLKWELLMIVPSKRLSFLFALSVSRWSHVIICFLLPYARKEQGTGQLFAGLVKEKEVILSTLCVVVISSFLGFKGFAVLLISWGIIYLLSRFYKRKLGGITGDVIGATGEIMEICVFIFIIVMTNLSPAMG